MLKFSILSEQKIIQILIAHFEIHMVLENSEQFKNKNFSIRNFFSLHKENISLIF
jgi:hypothetical protein